MYDKDATWHGKKLLEGKDEVHRHWEDGELWDEEEENGYLDHLIAVARAMFAIAGEKYFRDLQEGLEAIRSE